MTGHNPGHRRRMIQLTDDERDLLRATHRVIAEIVAVPSRASDVRTSMCGGGNGRWSYQVRGDRLTVWWPSQWNPQREASITLTRVRKWAESLPAEIRDRALAAWRVHPVDTRDIPRLYRITLEAIDHDRPKQLALFGEAS